MLKNKSLIGAATILVIVIAVLFVGTRMNPNTVSETDQMIIGASIFPLTDIAQQIGGDRVKVINVVPAGASPHSYSITPQQLADLTHARVIFQIGHGLDDNVTTAIASTHDIELVTVDNGINLREFEDHGHSHDHNDNHEDHDDHDEDHADDNDHHDDQGHSHEPGSIDPHYWLDAHNAEQIAKNIASHLSKIDPDHADKYESNLANYLEELKELDAELKAMAQTATQKHFIAMHDAWEYFAAHYGFEMVDTYEPVEGRQPSVADLNNLKNTIERYNITVFYTEPQKASTAATRLLEQEFGLTIKLLDPIGGIEENDSYIDLMKRNMQALIEAE